ncbi:COG3650 family protein [Aurantiacibacter sp. D1-12]|uniref:COG3650 family protein n=1 Tax=Aurantiacibacter sp. D1-12 TaxID=2993658 RepID=UPI00237CC31C|nr:hypothetical protein [Aurantiacibacter sp. D1-12]MDE1467690.1 hypothetical protein [Aurantiacibacter sp. D1-12]
MSKYWIAPLLALLAACNSTAEDGVPGDPSDSEPYSDIAEDQALRLIGTEPFWGADIADGTMTYSTPENIDGTSFPVTRFAGRGGLSFSGEMEGVQIDVLVTPGDCSDGMSDQVFPFNATIEIGDEQRSGCAYRDGVDDIGPPP